MSDWQNIKKLNDEYHGLVDDDDYMHRYLLILRAYEPDADLVVTHSGTGWVATMGDAVSDLMSTALAALDNLYDRVSR